jgi:hypothetical protein
MNTYFTFSGIRMQTTILRVAAIVGLVLTACSSESGQSVDKQLDELRKQRASIDQKIRELESGQNPAEALAGAQPVETLTLAPQVFEHHVDAKGTVDSRSSVTVSPLMGGRVELLSIANGQSVKKGQLLLELDNEVIKKGIDEVQVQLDFATTLFEKQKRIFEMKAGSEIQYLAAKNQKEALERRLESLKEQLSMSRIVAPTSGYIDNLTAKYGENLGPGMPICTIVNTSDMRVVVDLAEAFIPSITVGDMVTVHFSEIADSMVTKITTVAKTVNPVSRTFRVEIPLTSVPNNLRPNTTCRVVINDVTIPAALVLPLSAVLHDNSGSYAYVVDAKGTVRRRTLTTGLTSGGSIQILSGMQPGEKVITRGATDVADGQIVRVVN